MRTEGQRWIAGEILNVDGMVWYHLLYFDSVFVVWCFGVMVHNLW
jgi:hypothetical protein